MFRANRIPFSLFVAAVLLSSLTAQSIWKESKNPNWKQATGVEQYERLMWKAVQEKDWLAVESHMASNFVFSDANGVKDKAQRIADLRAMSNIPDVADAVVTPSGEHSIITYTLGKNRIMSVWQQQKSGWVMVAMASSAAN
jgi:hypothetical protein